MSCDVVIPPLAAPPGAPPGLQGAPPRLRVSRIARAAGAVAVVTVSSVLTGALVGSAVAAAAADRAATWVVGRSAGIASYLLLVALVGLGLLLAHPWRHRVSRPRTPTRIRTHVALAVFTLVFTTLHIVALATDHYAGVGWAGALLPMGSGYRPAAVTLGVLGLWAGLAAGVTAALAGRWAGRAWWPIHRVAAGSLLLVWAHGVWAGSDSRPLLALYVGSGLALLVLAAHRYAVRPARPPLAASPATTGREEAS